MCGKALIFLCITCILVDTASATFVSKCPWTDRTCLKNGWQKAIQVFADGIPDLNVYKQDPVTLDLIDASTSNLKLTITEAKLTGLRKCKVNKVQIYMYLSKVKMQIQCSWDIEGKYEMLGRLLNMPVEGNGNIHINFRKIISDTRTYFAAEENKDKKKYLQINKFKQNFHVTKAVFKFENLCPENTCLRNATEYVIANNAGDIFTEIGEPIIQGVVDKVMENVQNFFSAIPLADFDSVEKYFE